MPEAFTEVFMAVIFVHGIYRESFQWDCVLKASVEEIIIYSF